MVIMIFYSPGKLNLDVPNVAGLWRSTSRISIGKIIRRQAFMAVYHMLFRGNKRDKIPIPIMAGSFLKKQRGNLCD